MKKKKKFEVLLGLDGSPISEIATLSRRFMPVCFQVFSRLLVLGVCTGVSRLVVLGVCTGPFRGGLVSKAHRWVYHSTLGSRVMKKEKKFEGLLGLNVHAA